MVALVAWLVPRERNTSDTREGQALNGGLGSEADFGNETLRIGKEYWLSLPQAHNIGGEQVTILKARFVSLPKGLKLIGYKVVSTKDTDGYGMGTVLANSPDDEFTGGPKYSEKITVKAHGTAERYHVARFRVTGPITGDTSLCRFWYQKKTATYRQDLRCVNQLRLADN
ncbi:hypothetical protein [Streptomyces sp. 039-1]|uniref:hypothetical protein n=1 Tax=Streptomyces sp. 039-1 TaxID=2789263 RepID=UPI0039F64846